ncbi:MAG: hypothetical protein V2J89_11280 [Halieaceae bacterium]|jgi:hypothetical protein|nr:hypothetical protein [Halieaceae bacterium]
MGLPTFTETSVEVIGSEEHFGPARRASSAREVDVKIAARHHSAIGVEVFLKEMTGLALTAPPGLTSFAGARPKPSPVVRLFSCLILKSAVPVQVTLDDESFSVAIHRGKQLPAPARVLPPEWDLDDAAIAVPLESLAFARSGDKGNKANIGVIARDSEFLPYIARSLSAERVGMHFVHFLERPGTVERFCLPGTAALNFVLHDVLGGGGVASLRTDPQGKGYSQLMLAEYVLLPRALAKKHHFV